MKYISLTFSWNGSTKTTCSTKLCVYVYITVSKIKGKGGGGPITQNFKKKYPSVAKHYAVWNGSFVYENSLLSPREKHRIASWKGVDETVRDRHITHK